MGGRVTASRPPDGRRDRRGRCRRPAWRVCHQTL